MAFSKKKHPVDEEGQDEWFSVEVYRDENGLPGLAIVTTRGTLEYMDYSEWIKRKDSEELEKYTDEIQKYWPLPSNPEPYCNEYEQLIESLRNSGNHPEDHGLAEEFTRTVLRKIVQDLSLIVSLFLKLDSEMLYSLLHNIVVHSYFVRCFDVSPLILLDAERGSGKSTFLDYLKALCYHPIKMTNYSTASLALLADKYQATLLLDEGTKNFHSKDRGQNLTDFLTEGYSKNDATYIRTKGDNFESIKAQYHYTSVTATLLEDCPEDFKDRSIIVRMLKDIKGYKPLHVFGFDRYEAAERLQIDESDVPSFEEIRTRLYALRMIAIKAEVRKEKPAFSFEPFVNEARRYLRRGEEVNGSMRFLYGEVYGYEETPEFMGRAEDICLVHLPIAMALGTDKDIMDLMLARIEDDTELEYTTEATILRAFMDTIQDKMCEETIAGGSRDPPTWDDLVRILPNVSTKEVRMNYERIREERDDYGKFDFESPKKVTSIIKRFGFTYRTGTGGKSFFVPDPKLRRSLKSAVTNYGGVELKRFFVNV
jgi:hypothetical protein